MGNTKFMPHPKKNKFNDNIILGPRPKHKDLSNGRINAKAILCLLKPTEFTPEMEILAKARGYIWVNIPSDARPWASNVSPPKHWLEVAYEMDHLLDEEGSLYIHCAAGIHRTGLAAYTWYREYGGVNTHKEAFYYIVKHRPVIETDIGNKILVMKEYFDHASGSNL